MGCLVNLAKMDFRRGKFRRDLLSVYITTLTLISQSLFINHTFEASPVCRLLIYLNDEAKYLYPSVKSLIMQLPVLLQGHGLQSARPIEGFSVYPTASLFTANTERRWRNMWDSLTRVRQMSS